MVRLKKPADISLFKDISVNINNLKEVEAWVAVMKTVIAINCDELAFYDCLIYKEACVVHETEENDTVKIMDGYKHILFRFGSYAEKMEFCNAISAASTVRFTNFNVATGTSFSSFSIGFVLGIEFSQCVFDSAGCW